MSSLEIELKGSDLSSPDKLDYSVVDLPTHGVLKAGTDPRSCSILSKSRLRRFR